MPETPRGNPKLVSRRSILRGSATAGLIAAGWGAGAAIAPVATANHDSPPDWAIGPFTRYHSNPILTPQGTGFESNQVFNPGVVEGDGTWRMLYRGTRLGNVSEIGMATSNDGRHWTRHPENPVIGRTLPNETLAVEDPRLFYLDGTYYTFYTAFDGAAIDLNMAVSRDAVHWDKLGPIFGTKNGAVVTDPHGRPVKIDGHYLMYYGQSGSTGTHLGISKDMIRWTTAGPVDLHLPDTGAPYEVCVAVTNYPTIRRQRPNTNILLFIAGRMKPEGTWFYAISETLYSRSNPTKQIGHLDNPILVPTTSYEMAGAPGSPPATVFMNSILYSGDRWWMHYGAADTVTALATAPLRTPM